MLLDGIGLAGKERLVDEEVPRRDEPAVGGYDVAGGELHDVPGHEIVDRDGALLSVAHHLCAQSDRAPQRLHGILRPDLLG